MIHKLQIRQTKLEEKVRRLQAQRISSFLLFSAIMALSYFLQLEALYVPSLVVFIFIFSFLYIKHKRVARHLEHIQQLRIFLERQAARCEGRFKLLQIDPYANAFKDVPLSRDLDLVGEKSVYSQVTESLTLEGDLYLIESILNGNTKASLWQTLILEHKTQYQKDKRHFVKTLTAPKIHMAPLLNWTKDSAQIPIMAFIAVYIGYIVFLLSLFTPFKNIGLTLYLLSYVVSYSQFHRAFEKAMELEVVLFSLKNHIAYLINRNWLQASQTKNLNQVSRWISFLSVQANPLVLVLLNFVFPWTATFTHLLSRSKKKVEEEIPTLMQKMRDWDYLFSLRTLYQYQTKTFATMTTTANWKATNIYHPLLPNPKHNSFQLDSLALITGSNMSGKSTFLRTIGVNQVLAQMGAPVFASSLTTWPTKILSCIRVSDSLEHGISYFYAEVLRLKQITEDAKKGAYLFLIDEIFRGTNNKERYIGARSLILDLSTSGSIGVVTTHDLDLVNLETVNGKIKNYHFHDEVKGTELFFSYSLQSGPSKTTNALQILRNVGLPVLET